MKKQEIKKILVPTDFSKTAEIAMYEAITLAKKLKAEVILIHVMESIPSVYSGVPESQMVTDTTSELKGDVEKKMAELKEVIRKKSGITPKVHIAAGQVHTEIIDFSKNEKIDLIVMGTHGTSGFKELFIGSNAQRVVTLSEIPVLTMQKSINDPRLTNILIPIDNSTHSREKVHIAMIIAELFDAKIHLIGLPDSEDVLELKKFKTKLESVEKIIQEDKLLYITTIVHGDNLAETTLNYAIKHNCDLIVLNTGHESKLTGIFMGAFAQQIVNHSKIPVLSFKHSHGHFSIETPGVGIS